MCDCHEAAAAAATTMGAIFQSFFCQMIPQKFDFLLQSSILFGRRRHFLNEAPMVKNLVHYLTIHPRGGGTSVGSGLKANSCYMASKGSTAL